ncbi:MAG TPA: RibD family protein, partial [Niallia sp.]|nr:RibD family protein [Niallia sp.]
QVDAILVGVGTVLADNPKLTTRLSGPSKNPIRIILDTHLRTPIQSNVADTKDAKTIIVTSMESNLEKAKQLEEKGVQILRVPSINGRISMEEMLGNLYQLGITDILLEGGSEVNASFMRQGLIQKYLVYIAPKIAGGSNSFTPFRGEDIENINESVSLQFEKSEMVGLDMKITAYPQK